ncbi:MAG: hypothetical protein AB1797_00285 [bacterium]
MENPFRYGDIVRGDYFTDREKEIKEICQDMRSSQNIVTTQPPHIDFEAYRTQYIVVRLLL